MKEPGRGEVCIVVETVFFKVQCSILDKNRQGTIFIARGCMLWLRQDKSGRVRQFG